MIKLLLFTILKGNIKKKKRNNIKFVYMGFYVCIYIIYLLYIYDIIFSLNVNII